MIKGREGYEKETRILKETQRAGEREEDRRAHNHMHAHAHKCTMKQRADDLMLNGIFYQLPHSMCSFLSTARDPICMHHFSIFLAPHQLPLTSRMCNFSSQTWLGLRREMMLARLEESA